MNNKKKVAILMHGLGANGIDTLFANLSSKWDLDEFEVTYLLAVDEDSEQFWEKKVLSSGVSIVHLTDLDGKKLLKWPFVLRKALKKYGPFDAIHVNMDMLNGINLCVAKSVGIKNRVCHAHVSSNKTISNPIKRILKNAYLGLMKFLIKVLATDKIACSDLAGQYFYGEGNYTLMYNGIDIEAFGLSEENKETSDNTEKFITVGRMNKQKNPLFLVEIMKEIIKRKPKAKLLWIGGGELEADIKAKVKELDIENSIEFLGIRSDVREILPTADYFLLPSLYEGLSIALAEAQASGLDCFVSDTVSRLSDCGKCKFIPLDNSADQWADEICSYIDGGIKMEINPEQMDKFDICSMARKLEATYSK